MKALFAEFGEIKSAKIIKDRITGESKGFAFVEMPDNTCASAAIESIDSKEFAGRPLKVNEAKPKVAPVYNSFSSNYGYKTKNGY